MPDAATPNHRDDAALHILAELLSGIRHRDGPDDPTFSLSEIESDGEKVWTRLVMPSGDTYRVQVEWLTDESP
jgi:hypothetical protein